MLATLEASGSPGKLLPEQVWDGPPMPALELLPGAPSGSAMPLVWAHAEHIKLLRSLADGAVFDLPPQTVRRYQRERQSPRVESWRPDWRTPRIPAGRILRVELPAPATVTWRVEDAKAGGGNAGGGKVGGGLAGADVTTRDTGLGVHAVELPTAGLAGTLTFAWRGTAGDAGKGEVVVVASA